MGSGWGAGGDDFCRGISSRQRKVEVGRVGGGRQKQTSDKGEKEE